MDILACNLSNSKQIIKEIVTYFLICNVMNMPFYHLESVVQSHMLKKKHVLPFWDAFHCKTWKIFKTDVLHSETAMLKRMHFLITEIIQLQNLEIYEGCNKSSVTWLWCDYFNVHLSDGSRISLRWGHQPSRGCQHKILPNFSKKCMKLKKFGPSGHTSLVPP